MKCTYEPLFETLRSLGMSKSDLAKGTKISPATLAKLGNDEPVALEVIGRICSFLGVSADKVVSFLADEKVSPFYEALRDEMRCGTKGGIYHEFQIAMTYNSNHIEGSKLSEDDTRYIFETNTLLPDGSRAIPVNDVTETINHFDAIRFVIDHAMEPLSETFIKRLHFILKNNTLDARRPGFVVGDYKAMPNMVGGLDTAAPSKVKGMMAKLLRAYFAKPGLVFEDLVDFHYRFESIHPFQDGNGCVGRLILMKECLRLGYLPVIIDEEIKAFYYRGLREYEESPGYLIDTCKAGQDKVRKLCSYFQIPFPKENE